SFPARLQGRPALHRLRAKDRGHAESGPETLSVRASCYPSGRFSLIALCTALSAARRSAGSAARYWATLEAVMLATIPAAVRGRELSGGRMWVGDPPRAARHSVSGTQPRGPTATCTTLP